MICKTSLKAQNKDEFYTALSGGVLAMILIAGAAAVGGAVVLGATDLVETGLTQASVQIPTANLYKVGTDLHLTLNVKNSGNELLDDDNFSITISGKGGTTTYLTQAGYDTDKCVLVETFTQAVCDKASSTTVAATEGNSINHPALDSGLAPGSTWAFTGKVLDDDHATSFSTLNLAKGSEALITISFGDISQSVTTRVR